MDMVNRPDQVLPSLPREIFCLLSRFLHWSDLLSIRAVCKSWHNITISEVNLSSALPTSGSRKLQLLSWRDTRTGFTLGSTTLDFALDFCPPGSRTSSMRTLFKLFPDVTDLQLGWINEEASKELPKNLRCLRLEGLSSCNINDVLVRCTNLISLNCERTYSQIGNPLLKQLLHLTSMLPLVSPGTQLLTLNAKLTDNIPNWPVRRATLGVPAQPKHGDLSEVGIDVSLPQLRALRLSFSFVYVFNQAASSRDIDPSPVLLAQQVFETTLYKYLRGCPRLENLALLTTGSARYLSDASLSKILASCGQLNSLSLDNFENAFNPLVPATVRNYTLISRLAVEGDDGTCCSACHDELPCGKCNYMGDLARAAHDSFRKKCFADAKNSPFPNLGFPLALQSLFLAETELLTSDSLKGMLDRCSNLTKLTIIACDKLDSASVLSNSLLELRIEECGAMLSLSIDTKNLRVCDMRRHKALKSVDIAAPEMISLSLERCTSLSQIELGSSKKLQTLSVAQTAYVDISSLLMKSNMPALRSLTLVQATLSQDSPTVLQSILSKSSCLDSLIVARCLCSPKIKLSIDSKHPLHTLLLVGLLNVRKISVSASLLRRCVIAICPQVESVSISCEKLASLMVAYGTLSLTLKLQTPVIEELHLRGVINVSSISVLANLRILTIGASQSMTNDALKDLLASCSVSLNTLFLFGCNKLTMSPLPPLPKLQQLFLWNLQQVSMPKSLQELLSVYPQLRSLDLRIKLPDQFAGEHASCVHPFVKRSSGFKQLGSLQKLCLMNGTNRFLPSWEIGFWMPELLQLSNKFTDILVEVLQQHYSANKKESHFPGVAHSFAQYSQSSDVLDAENDLALGDLFL